MDLPPLPAYLDLGLVTRCDVVIDHYDANAAGARGALQKRSNGMFGSVFGPQQGELSALASVIENGRREINTRRSKVLAGSQDFSDYVTAAKAAEKDVNETAGYANASSLEDVLAKTAQQSGQDVADTATLAASTVGRFAISAIPWWLWIVGGAALVWKLSPRGRAAT